MFSQQIIIIVIINTWSVLNWLQCKWTYKKWIKFCYKWLYSTIVNSIYSWVMDMKKHSTKKPM